MKNFQAIRKLIGNGANLFVGRKLGKDYQKLTDEVLNAEDEFLQQISTLCDVKQAYEKLERATDNLWLEECVWCYEQGFRLGIQLGIDVACEPEA